MGKRLVLNFHGIGEPHAWVSEAEHPFWCGEREFLVILDAIPQTSTQMRIPIEITFDDGNISDFAIAAPALQARGLTAAIFVCAGRIGKPGYLEANQMRELARAGMAIGSHGWDHVNWRRVFGDQALAHEIRDARDHIAQTVGQPIDRVAIPFGSYDARVWKFVTNAFREVQTSDGGLAPLSGRIVPRETYSIEWDEGSLRKYAAPRPLTGTIRQSLAMAYKRHR